MRQVQARCLQAALGLLGVGCFLTAAALTPARGETPSSYHLMWYFATMTKGGPVATKTPERKKFEKKGDCTTFGAKMTPRMEDWVRGLVRADWDHPVGVRFVCDLDGKPS